jgi:hypothetical protein
VSCGNDLIAYDEYSTDRRFSKGCGLLSLSQRLAHELFIIPTPELHKTSPAD